MKIGRRSALVGFFLCAVACRRAERTSDRNVQVAAAANVHDVLLQIGDRFRKDSDCALTISAGSSGKLFAQIQNGAPFDVLLSADSTRPAELEQHGQAVSGSRFTYAEGRLALFGPGLTSPNDGTSDLRAGRFRHLAIANPDTAPYGAAAVQALERLGIWPAVRERAVRGENVAQTLQFVESGGAELGLVALSTVIAKPGARYWLVPRELHDPIRQDAVLLARAKDNTCARSLLTFLRGAPAQELLHRAGYDVPK